MAGREGEGTDWGARASSWPSIVSEIEPLRVLSRERDFLRGGRWVKREEGSSDGAEGKLGRWRHATVE